MAHPAVKDFVRLMNKLDRSKRRTEVFADFCELAYCALAKVASPCADQRDKLEAQYMSVVKRYPNKDDIRAMPELLGLFTMTLSTGGLDFLGQAASELGALDAGLGQFFTPYDVSRLMAEINMGDSADQIAEKGFITIQEPAAGAGGMLIAAADVLEEKGFDLARHAWFEAVELSRSTYHMLYIQMAARGIAGRAYHGNSLSLEMFDAAYTAHAATFYSANKHPFAKQIEAATKAKQEADKRANLIAMLEQQHLPAL